MDEREIKNEALVLLGKYGRCGKETLLKELITVSLKYNHLLKVVDGVEHESETAHVAAEVVDAGVIFPEENPNLGQRLKSWYRDNFGKTYQDYIKSSTIQSAMARHFDNEKPKKSFGMVFGSLIDAIKG